MWFFNRKGKKSNDNNNNNNNQNNNNKINNNNNEKDNVNIEDLIPLHKLHANVYFSIFNNMVQTISLMYQDCI